MASAILQPGVQHSSQVGGGGWEGSDHQAPFSSLLRELVHVKATPSPSLSFRLSFTEKKGHHWPQYNDVPYPSTFSPTALRARHGLELR